MSDRKPDEKTETTKPEDKPDDRDAMLDGGQADYGSAGGLAQEGVNGAEKKNGA